MNIVEHLPLAGRIATKWWDRGRTMFVEAGVGYDDVYAEAVVALITESPRYDALYGAGTGEFVPWIVQRINWRLGDYWRSVFGRKDSGLRSQTQSAQVRLDAPLGDTDATAHETVGSVDDDLEWVEILDAIDRLPKARHRRVLRARLNGLTLAEHARIEGVVESRACQILAEARCALARALRD